MAGGSSRSSSIDEYDRDTEIKAMAIAAVNEPPAKRARTGWDDLKLNINHALVSDVKGSYFSTLANSEVTVLDGIGTHAGFIMKDLGCETVLDLANYKFYHLAKAITTLADYESHHHIGNHHGSSGRPANSLMNMDDALVHEYETKSFKEILHAPLHVLQGVGDKAESFEALGVKTVKDLGTFKFCKLAEAIVEASKHEQILTDKERKVERELKKLA